MTTGGGAKQVKGVKSSFTLYREGRSTPEIRMTVHMVLTARRWRSLLDERLRPIEQSSARMEAMSAILNSPPLSPQVEIARRLRIEGPTLTRMLDTLEKDGLVERLPDPKDRRTNQLRLTGSGEAELARIFAISDAMRGRLLEGFSEEQILQVNEVLEVLLARLDAGLPDTEE
ncbi:MarR family transcriptional regulator [Erythrobacter sp. SG61-1L]|uniref:MarR family winged helix-turn-helix transcriptional regulator n=1 Tax=Erythrobacter sp. SG61-1L TaxID=1603897 RepID=UPI0006C8FDA1|nr:MarR family transcriptional regulator [Erythrobacter sp. SG61-1L]